MSGQSYCWLLILVSFSFAASGISLLASLGSLVLTVFPLNTERPEVAPLFIPKKKIGTDLSIACNVLSGNKPVSFTWRRNNEVISDSNIHVDPKEGLSSLKLVNLTQSHRGSYSCTAKNSFGEDTKTAVLDLSGMYQIRSSCSLLTSRIIQYPYYG